MNRLELLSSWTLLYDAGSPNGAATFIRSICMCSTNEGTVPRNRWMIKALLTHNTSTDNDIGEYLQEIFFVCDRILLIAAALSDAVQLRPPPHGGLKIHILTRNLEGGWAPTPPRTPYGWAMEGVGCCVRGGWVLLRGAREQIAVFRFHRFILSWSQHGSFSLMRRMKLHSGQRDCVTD